MQWGKEGELKVSLRIPGLGKVEALERTQRQTMQTMKRLFYSHAGFPVQRPKARQGPTGG